MSLVDAVERMQALEALVTPSAAPAQAQPAASSSFATTLAAATATGDDYDSLVQSAASRYGVDPRLVQAVMQQESGGNPNATSSAGAEGLMQLMPDTASSLGVADPYDPAQSIDGGTRYLRGLLDEFGGNTTLALAAYSAGAGAVKEYGGVPPYPETQQYVSNVLARAGAAS